LVFVCSKRKLDVLYTEIGYSLLFRQKNFKPVKYGRGWGVKYLPNFNINHRKLDRFSVFVSSDTPTYDPKKVQTLFCILSVAFFFTPPIIVQKPLKTEGMIGLLSQATSGFTIFLKYRRM